MIKILLVEDAENMRSLISAQLRAESYHVDEAADLKSAVKRIRKRAYDVFLLDLTLPDGESLALLEEFPAQTKDRTVIITGNATIPSVIKAIQKGASNYLEKPVKPGLLKMQIKKILELSREAAKHNIVAGEVAPDYTFDSIIYQSNVMQELISRAKKLAATGNTILICGETGVGKEVLAHAIHNHSFRKDQVFLPINCAAIPAELFETELFGFEKGAFTGAVSTYQGRFLQADKGTLFMDELGELPLQIQAKLLRVLDERLIYRLKSTRSEPVNVRLIAATNCNLSQDVKARQFRSDLYYRLKESAITIPPLRERREDILLLFHHYMQVYNHAFGKRVNRINREAEDFLLNHRWDGNIRELKNMVKNIIPLKSGETMELSDLSSSVLEKTGAPVFKMKTLEDMERNYILQVLKMTTFNIKRSAAILGINRPRLYRKIAQYGLDDIVEKT
ncbi:MAG: sigma-54-dependent Fis family transcriptional regulator [bacterium]|nr:sigma-54-dependent Fis family transcriptional regulator [bacterium]